MRERHESGQSFTATDEDVIITGKRDLDKEV